MKYKLFSRSILFLACFFILTSEGGDPSFFKIILMPDTQTYSESYPEILNAQTAWVAKNAKEFSFVLQQGDITDDNTNDQWKVASEAFCKLDGLVPYTLVPGNHDTGENGKTITRDTRLFNMYFPYSKYSVDSTFGGAFVKGEMDNTWRKFRAGGYDWLILSLEFGPRTSVLKWAAKVVEEHPYCKVIINTHAYLYSDNKRMSSSYGHKWVPKDYGIGKGNDKDAVNDGEQMWNKLIREYQNILFVFCGHILNSGTGVLVSQGKHGNRVYQILANYQGGVDGSEKGGSGFLRIVTIDPRNSSFSVKTYSPYLDQFKTEPNQEFTFKDVKF